MIDIFPEFMAGERARLHNAMSKIFAIRVSSGALVIKDDDERAKLKLNINNSLGSNIKEVKSYK